MNNKKFENAYDSFRRFINPILRKTIRMELFKCLNDKGNKFIGVGIRIFQVKKEGA